VAGGEASPAKVESPGTGEVVAELAPAAAVGALSGVAKSVLPAEKGKATRKKSSKR
jgi:hypothetical protein